ncbi:ATP-grasp domain-containing protein [Chitinimonas sp. PSY-7]|uniref:ATP-grasp domain-containing protein n=1 Tax=Chitinimonas sp. PSY-7 TaxID=3459088 RepID=UPI0040400FD3
MLKRIVVLETSDVGARYTGLAIRQLGFEPLFLVSGLAQYQADTRRQLVEFDVLECGNTRDADIVCQALTHLPTDAIEAVTTLLDSRIGVAQQVATKLGVRGLDPALGRISAKAEVASLLPEYSPHTITVKVGDDLSAALAGVSAGQRLIVKPSHGAGAQGYAEFDVQDGYIEQLQQHIHHQADALRVDTFLIQERLNGRLVSLEGYVIEGACHFLGFSSRKKIRQTETANLFPADSHLSQAARDTAKQAIATLVERAGYRQGYFHSEFLVDGNTARLIDANIGRIAGAAVSEQMAIALGIDPVALFRHVVGVGSLGLTQSLSVHAPQETLSVFYGLLEKEKLESIVLPKAWSLRHTQLLDEQTEIPAMGGDNWAWIGLASGPAKQVLEQIDQIQLITSKGTRTPYYLEAGQTLTDW